MNPVREHLPLLAHHAGAWEGEFAHFAPHRSLPEQLSFRILVEFPEDAVVHYRPMSRYWWPDGSRRELAYERRHRDGCVVFDDGRVRRSCRELDDRSRYLRFAFGDDPDGYVCEIIQLSPDGAHRARTWHWFRHDALWRTTLVREHRVGADATVFLARLGQAPRLPWRSTDAGRAAAGVPDGPDR